MRPPLKIYSLHSHQEQEHALPTAMAEAEPDTRTPPSSGPAPASDAVGAAPSGAAAPVEPPAAAPTAVMSRERRTAAVQRRVQELLAQARLDADVETEARAEVQRMLLARALPTPVVRPPPPPPPQAAAATVRRRPARTAPVRRYPEPPLYNSACDDCGSGYGQAVRHGCDRCGGFGDDCRCSRQCSDFRPRYVDKCCPVSCFPSVGCGSVCNDFGCRPGYGGCGVYGGYGGCGVYGGYGAYGYGACGPWPSWGVAAPVTQQAITSVGSVCGPSGCSLTVQPALQACSIGGCVTTPLGPPNLAGTLPSWV